MSLIYTCMYILCLSATVSDGSWIARVIPTHRECDIKIKNHCTSHKLTDPSVYMSSGSSSIPFPVDVGPNMEAALAFAKTPYAAKGAVGVFTYSLFNTETKRVDKKFAFMFSVPYNFHIHSNWFAAGFFPKDKACDYNLYREMYYNSEIAFVRHKAERPITHRDGSFTVKASMTNTYTPSMRVDIYDG